MATTIVIFCILVLHLHAENITSTTTPSWIDVEKELARISKHCVPRNDYQELTGNVGFPLHLAQHVAYQSARETVLTIGLQEMRSILHFSPLGPWKPYNGTSPSQQELDEAPTLEAYYELREPRDSILASDSEWLLEKYVTDVLRYLDKHQPTIRGIFKQTFEERLVKEEQPISKRIVDAMILEYYNTIDKVDPPVNRMFFVSNCPR